MTDRVFPASKPQTLNGSNPPTFPATKGQLYGATRPAYRPTPKPPRRRNRCCLCCCWLTLVLLALILLLAITAGVLWVLYRPQRPSFSVSSLQFSSFNLSASSSPKVNALLNVALLARNPNKKLVFFYDPISVSVSSGGADIADGSFPAFTHGTKNSTTLKAAVSSGGAKNLDSGAAASLKSDLKKNELPLTIKMETKVKVKMGGLKTNRVGIKVTCDGIQAPLPKGKAKAASVSGPDAKCKVKLRIKIWKWQIN